LVTLTISLYNGFFKLVEVEELLQIHSCFFSHDTKQCGLPLSAVTVSLHHLPKMSEVNSHQCCHSILTSFPYNKHEKSLHFPTQSETKNAIIFSYNIWPWNTTLYTRGRSSQ